MNRTLSTSLLWVWASLFASAQWLKYPDSGIPRTPDGKPNLSAPAPKMPDGKPDLSGVWAVVNSELDPRTNEQVGPNQFLNIAPDEKGQPYRSLPYRPGM